MSTTGTPIALFGLQSKYQAPSATPKTAASAAKGPESTTTAEGFKPDAGGTEQTSGEVLLIEAYAAVWLVLFALVFLSLRRQRKLDDRIDQLSADLSKARDQADGAG